MDRLTGNLSCAFLKILQIIRIFNISLPFPCIGLADDEGSISKVLTKYLTSDTEIGSEMTN